MYVHTSLSRRIAGRLTAGALATGLLGFVPLRAQSPQTLLHHVPSVAAQAQRLARMTANTPMSLSIGLPLRNQDQLHALLEEQQTPGHINYHRYLTVEQFTDRFGPTVEDHARLIAYMEAHGLKVTHTYANRALINVSGDAQTVERTFNVRLHHYQHPDGRRFFAPDVDPSLDLEVTLGTVKGLDSAVVYKPAGFKIQPKDVVANLGTGSGGLYIGRDLRTAYAPGISSTGQGQGIALVEFSNYYHQDPANYWLDASMAAPQVIDVNVAGGNSSYGGEGEVSLDIEVAGAIAPQATIYVYMGPDGNSIFNKIASDNLCKSVGISWGWGNGPSDPIDTTQEAAFQQMNAQGITTFVASGDSAKWNGTSQIVNPADSPLITSVGGTDLSTASAGGAWSGETAWSSGGGGYSARYPLPTWQSGMNWSSIPGSSTTLRNAPDVAMVASNIYLDAGNGQRGQGVGGTSVAAPLWAAFAALTNQAAASQGKAPLGFLNPTLYAVGRGSGGSTAFHDITSGSNGNAAKVGFDTATGWGSPAGTATLNALLGSATPVVGVFISPTTLSLNTGASATFTATVTGATNTAVTWSATGGSITSTGLYTAPATVGTYTVKATSVADTTKSASATVTVTTAGSVAVTINPTSVSLNTGATQTFTAAVTGSTNTAVTWSATGGSITSGGLYTAPATTGTYTVKATSAADTTKSASATVTVTTGGTPTELIVNGGFETGTTPWVGTTGAIGAWSSNGEPAHVGTRSLWLLGNGKAATESLYQQVTIPASASSAKLSFWMHIDTAETDAVIYDTLKVQVLSATGSVLGTLATYSNLNKASGYAQKTFDLSAYKGQTVRIAFNGVEDASLQTSFVIDDVSVTIGAVTPGPLAITSQPSSTSVAAGSTASFTVSASGGTPPYSYQWLKGGSAISGATAATYTFTAQAADNGAAFSARVTDAVSTTLTSNAATLTIAANGGWSQFVPPTVTFTDNATSLEGSTILRNAIPDVAKMMKDQCLLICQQIYTDNNDPRNNFTKLNLQLDNDPNEVAWKAGDPPEITISIGAQYLAKFYHDNGNDLTLVAKEVKGILSHEGNHGYQWAPKNCGAYDGSSVFWAFVEGESDGVRAELTNWTPTRYPSKGGSVNSGYTTTGFFLSWVKNHKKPTFLIDLNHAAHNLATFTWDAAFQQILGQSVTSVWNEYQATLP